MRKLTTTLFGLLIGSASMYAQKTDIYLETNSFDATEAPSITLDNVVYYTLGNSINNPTFSLDPRKHDGQLPLWTVGNYSSPMTSDNFTWHKHGGFDNGAWIESTQSGDASASTSIAERWTLQPNTKYYLRFWTKNLTAENQSIPVVSLTNELSTEGGQNEYGTTGKTLLGKNANDTSDSSFGMANASANGEWTYTAIIFDSENYTNLQFSARNLDKIGFDGFYLTKLLPASEMTEDNEELIKEEYYKYVKSYYYFEASRYDSAGITAVSRAMAEKLESEECSYENTKDDIKGLESDLENYLSDLTKFEDFDVAEIYLLYKKARPIILETTEKLPDTEETSKLKALLQTMDDFYEEGFSADEAELTDFYKNTLSNVFPEILACLRKVDKMLNEPIDLTWAISAPNFTTTLAEPTITYKKDYSGIESITYPHASLYTDKEGPQDQQDTSVNNWNKASKFDVYWDENRIFLLTDDTNTSIKDLVPGFYTLSAEIMTRTDDEAKPVITFGGVGGVSTDTLETTNNEWLYYTTPQTYNPGKDIYIQATASNEDCRFGLTNLRLLYYGNTESKTKEIVDNLKTSIGQYLNEEVKFKGDKKALIESFKEANEKLEANQTLAGYNDYIDDVYELTNTGASSNAVYDEYLSCIEKMTENFSKGDLTKKMIETLEAQLHDLLDADDATSNAIETSDYFYVLRNYTYQYLPLLNKIELLNLYNDKAKENQKYALTQAINSHSEAALPTTAKEVMDEVEILEKQYAAILGQDAYGTGDNDLTGVICNPGFDSRHQNAAKQSFTGVSGWTINNDANTSTDLSRIYNVNNYDDSEEQYYFNASTYKGNVNCTIKQTLTDIPNGIYTLTAKMRTEGDGYYLVAGESEDFSDASFAAAHVQKTDKWYIDPENYEKGQEYVESADTYGPIWAAAKEAFIKQPDLESPLQGIVETNRGKGNGWFNLSLTVEVKNHKLTIGATTDSAITEGHTDTEGNATVAYQGTFISLEDMSLTLDNDYDKGSWSITGIENAINKAAADNQNGVEAIYDLNGRRINQFNATNKGIYIVKKNGKTIKMLKK